MDQAKRKQTSNWSFMIGILVGVIFLGWNAAGAGRAACNQISYLLVTVDTESLMKNGFDLPDQWDCVIDGQACGIEEMIRIADVYGIKITFYFNVYETSRFSVQPVKELVQKIFHRGHDIQLHTHPEFLLDPGRLKMFEYSREEQSIIIREGICRLEDWIGVKPVAHRAGTYSANEDTLMALNDNSIIIDSSFYFNNKVCQLRNDEFYANALTKRGFMIEIPVTVFYVNESFSVGGLYLPAKRRLKKVDIDSCSWDLLKSTILALSKSETQTITFFMHSWSFVKEWSKDPEYRMIDRDDITDFGNVLQLAIDNPSIVPISTQEFWYKYQKGEIVPRMTDHIPTVPVKIDIITYIRRFLGINRQNYLYWIIGILSVFMFLGFLIHLKFNRFFKIRKFNR